MPYQIIKYENISKFKLILESVQPQFCSVHYGGLSFVWMLHIMGDNSIQSGVVVWQTASPKKRKTFIKLLDYNHDLSGAAILH